MARQHHALHAHGCLICGVRYADNCADASHNGRCQACRGKQRPIWEVDRDPRECCRVRSRPTSREENARYALAGDTGWFICPVCWRTHPYDPRTGSLR